LTREVDSGARERIADALTTEPGASHEARHGPDALVVLVLRSARPRNATESDVGRARLDRAPADGLAVEVRDEAAGRAGIAMAAARLLA
jgi:hypothetical protein